MSHRRTGFTLLEVTIVSGLMALLAMLLSAAWAGVGRPAADLIARAQIAQEMEMAVSALGRDLGGSLADTEGRLGGKKQARWVGWLQPTNSELWLCFDGGAEPNGEPDWGPPDAVVVYRLDSDTLIRWDPDTNATFTVARNVADMEVATVGADVGIVLSFEYRQLTRTCTLIAKQP